MLKQKMEDTNCSKKPTNVDNTIVYGCIEIPVNRHTHIKADKLVVNRCSRVTITPFSQVSICGPSRGVWLSISFHKVQ